MVTKKTEITFLVVVFLLLGATTFVGANGEPSGTEIEQYKQEQNSIKALRKAFKDGPVNDLKKYEEFADKIKSKWAEKDKKHYAKLMLEICEPLTSGRFNEDRQFIVARRYALLALAEPNEIPVETELELVGHVSSDMATPLAPKGDEWAQQRREDVVVRLHAWNRLIDAIDPNWDPNEEVWSPNAVGALMGLPSGIAPESVQNPHLRAQYEAALEANQRKIEEYSEQNNLHKWQKRFLKTAERYIIEAYSRPPFAVDELEHLLTKYEIEGEARERIIAAVKAKMPPKPPVSPPEDANN